MSSRDTLPTRSGWSTRMCSCASSQSSSSSSPWTTFPQTQLICFMRRSYDESRQYPRSAPGRSWALGWQRSLLRRLHRETAQRPPIRLTQARPDEHPVGELLEQPALGQLVLKLDGDHRAVALGFEVDGLAPHHL